VRGWVGSEEEENGDIRDVSRSHVRRRRRRGTRLVRRRRRRRGM